MKILITEEQYNTTQTKLKNMVKKLGWIPTAKAVGGSKNLVKLGFNNDPMEFLNNYKDLNVVQSEENPDWTLFQNEKRKTLLLYVNTKDKVYIDYRRIYRILEIEFGLNYFEEIFKVIKDWFVENYGIDATTVSFDGIYDIK